MARNDVSVGAETCMCVESLLTTSVPNSLSTNTTTTTYRDDSGVAVYSSGGYGKYTERVYEAKCQMDSPDRV